jgi:hypothetical protein
MAVVSTIGNRHKVHRYLCLQHSESTQFMTWQEADDVMTRQDHDKMLMMPWLDKTMTRQDKMLMMPWQDKTVTRQDADDARSSGWPATGKVSIHSWHKPLRLCPQKLMHPFITHLHNCPANRLQLASPCKLHRCFWTKLVWLSDCTHTQTYWKETRTSVCNSYMSICCHGCCLAKHTIQ